METTEEARRIIESIQRRYYLHPDDIAARERDPHEIDTKRHKDTIEDTERTLKLISLELYKDLTHFILELIQNADDNTYTNETPTLVLKLSRTQLIVECNEIGFNEANVRALCKVNDSTKILQKGMKNGCTGEKGIGFKSVFSVASRVSISSNAFNFCFDTSRPLGMINPILLSHPVNNALEGWTIFVLDLSIDDAQFAVVKAALQDIRPEMLLFTRRLQELKISLGPSPAEETLYTVTKNFDDAYSVWTLNSRSAENEQWTYFRQEWVVTDMPEHSQRKGIKESKIVLAFPFNDDETKGAIVREQQIFAFMPLYRSPLPFLVQSDFLTQTSREGIREQDPWNLKLRNAIEDCFTRSILNMKEDPTLDIPLIQYIPYQASHLEDKFLAPVVHAILAAIETLPIIRTRSGNWLRPGHALIVPPRLMFDNKPLFTETELKYGITKSYEYVDPEYQKLKIHPILTEIGCQTLSHFTVFSIVSNDRFPFSNKSYRWLAVLFQYLYRNSSDSNFSQYNKPSYLQLASGQWTSKASREVYFPATALDINFSNLNIAVLHRNFCQEIEANEYAGLFLTRILKIKTLSDSEIILAIIDYHRRSPSTLDVQMCFDHALYLSQRRHLISQEDLPSFAESFHLVGHLDHVVAGHSNVLIDREIQMTPHVLLSRICASSSFHFLSSKYPPGVVDFLIRYLTLASWLPVTQTGIIPFYTEILSPRRQSSNVLLYYLADIWDQLRSSSIPIVFAAFTRALQSVECICEDNNPMARLSSCYLRTRHLDTLLTSGRNVLEVDFPDAPKWIFLKNLGVTLEPNLEIYLEQLRRRKTDVRERKIRPINVDWFYKDLVLFCNVNQSKFSLIRSVFQNEALLLIKSGSSNNWQWARPNDIFQGCPSFVRSTIRFSCLTSAPYYTILCDKLELPHWSTELQLKSELESGVRLMQLARESPESISHYVFSALTSIIQEGHITNPCPSWVSSILKLPIFPVATKHGTVEITALSPDIFVPNSELLNPLFAGKVNLLNFEDNYVRDIVPLLECSGIDLKYLSTYNDPETMAVKLLQPVRDEVTVSRDLFRKKEELTRLFYSRTKGRSRGYDWMKAKWEKLKIMMAAGLVQDIILPDFGINETQRRASHFVDGETPFIVIDGETKLNTAKVLISSHLAKYFDSPALESDILIILVLPKEDLEELLKTKMDLPALPQSWSQRFEAELRSASLAENTELAENIELLQISSAENSITVPFRQVERHHQILSSSPIPSSRAAEDGVDPIQPALHTDNRQIHHDIIEDFGRQRVPRPWPQSSILQPSRQVDGLSLEPSRKDAEDIMRMVRSTLEEEDGQFHAIVEQLPIPIVEPWINAATDAIPVATEGTVSHRTSEGLLMTSPDMTVSHNLQSSASFTSEDLMITNLEASAFRPHQTPFMSESNVNIFQDDGEDPGAGLARIMSGFSGEFFIYEFLKRRLPGFSESNWTSGLKRLAGFDTRREGLADFEYRGEMGALKSALKLRRNEAWEIAYIEVKSSVNTKNFFYLSHGQFERLQRFHGSKVLYMIVVVHNVMTKPEILTVFDDPVRFLYDRKLWFQTEGKVIGRWVHAII